MAEITLKKVKRKTTVTRAAVRKAVLNAFKNQSEKEQEAISSFKTGSKNVA